MRVLEAVTKKVPETPGGEGSKESSSTGVQQEAVPNEVLPSGGESEGSSSTGDEEGSIKLKMKKLSRKRHNQRFIAGKCDRERSAKSTRGKCYDAKTISGAVSREGESCTCSEKMPPPVVAGTRREDTLHDDGNVSTACSVAAVIKHVLAPVCTWKASDIDDICTEGGKLNMFVAEAGKSSDVKGKCTLIQQHSVFGRKFKVRIGKPQQRHFNDSAEEPELHEVLQEHLLRDGMCLLNMYGEVSAIIHHDKHLVFVDCGSRDASGLASSVGTPVAVFNSSLHDLMLHIRNLKESFGAKWYAISSISVKEHNVECVEGLSDSDMEVAVHPEDSRPVSVECPTTSVQGSFHQGDSQFEYGGLQCMAVGLVSIAKHSTHCVFSWQSSDLDEVVVSGDELYSSLRATNAISGGSQLLCVPDLPKDSVINGRRYDFSYGDYVTGDVDLVEGELIELGVHVTLRKGLQKILTQYNTCLMTLRGSTCAIICQQGRYAVVDSHARNALGMVDAGGQSVVVYFSDFEGLFSHICRFAEALNTSQKPFEIAGVCVTQNDLVDSGRLSFGQNDPVVTETTLGSSLHQKSIQPTPGCSNRRRGTKRKVSKGNTNSKKVKTNATLGSSASQTGAMCKVAKGTCTSPVIKTSVTEVEPDIVFVSDVISKQLQFRPLCNEVSQILCKQLDIVSEKDDSVSTNVGALGAPCLNDKIVGDGNCFFRAISQAVSGTQRYHRKVRLAVVKHIKSNAEAYTCHLRSEYNSITEYLILSRMSYVGSWATEIEIQATADFLGISIFTYHTNRWLEYSCTSKQLTTEGLYLENCNGNHYESVVCVQQPGMLSCYCYCKEDTPCSTDYSRRQSKRKMNTLENLRFDTSCVLEPVADISEQPDSSLPATDIDFVMLSDESVEDDITELHSTFPAKDIDSVIFNDVPAVCWEFHPLTSDVAKSVCNLYNLSYEKQDVKLPTMSGSLGAVCKTRTIVKDKNSFFRAIAQAVSGSQKCHRKIRLAVVKYMEDQIDNIKIIEKGYASISHYIKETHMKYVGYDATEIEIEATANAFGLDIYIYSGKKWFKYNSVNPVSSEVAIYLKHDENNHYEPVLCVKHITEVSCFDLCKMDISSETQYMRRRSNVKFQDSSNICSPTKLSTYLKRKKGIQLKALYLGSSFRRQKLNTASKKLYQENLSHRLRVQQMSKANYKDNLLYKENVKQLSKNKYHQNHLHKENKKKQSIKKYQQNLLHKENVKKLSKNKYQQNQLHKEMLKEFSKNKYWTNLIYRQKVKARSKNKYGNILHKKRVIARNKTRFQQRKEQSKLFDFVMEQFSEKVRKGPEFVCCVCNRLLFEYQVSHWKNDYGNREDIALIAEKCISRNHLHECDDDCVVPCKWLDMGRGKLWICYTCHSKIKRGVMPPECVLNNMQVHPIPEELACLNSLEQHLIALHIPFMKMLALPKGGQNGVHGPVTCVPANIVETTNLLPRSEMDGSLLRVKLKRKLTYKGHYEYQFVDPLRIKKALMVLKKTNVYYKDVEFNENWLNDFCREEDKNVDNDAENNQTAPDVSDELLHDRQQHCMFQDTCLMPVDIGQEVLDQYFDSTLNLAPAEGSTPVKLLTDISNEAKSFPVLFPQGSNTFHDYRQQKLTLARYLNLRLLNADNRFGNSVEYIFYSQYVSEVQQVISSVSIALRKGKAGHNAKSIDVDLLKDQETLKNLLQFDNGFRFLKPIRGTPSFWQGAQHDLMACVRQLGVPTWFCSFSSADLRWKSLLTSILKQEGRTQTLDDLEWSERCELLRRNPVTAARMFDYRWHCFLREVLMSPSQPIGKIIDFFYRVEFQQRGSPHVHCLFWIENAPKLDKNTDDEVVQFIDKYVTCELPSQDEPLKAIVTSVQQHSKRHSKSCKKKHTICRFNFPRPASTRTFICRKTEECEQTCLCNVTPLTPCGCGHKERLAAEEKKRALARKMMTSIKLALSNEEANFGCVAELFEALGINQTTFEAAYNCVSRNTHVVLKRDIDEVWINQYNRNLLKCWDANLDIQYVVNAYACVVYIISYISKAEKEMGLLLRNAHREASKHGNVDAKDALKKLGSVYLHNRDVCAQEAVYRLTGMHLKECSRKVQFVPTGDTTVKISLPLSVLKQKADKTNLSTADMWMIGLEDRYKNRPNDAVFNDVCLASFASEYRVLSKNERTNNRIQLKNNLGFVVKRTRSQPAVVRYARFSKTKCPEKFFQSILQLFMPYRVDSQLKPSNCETFQLFYENGHVTCNDGSRQSVKSIVDKNRALFEVDSEELDTAQQCIDDVGVLEDAWCELCPEQELERLESEQERRANDTVEEHVESIPDLAVSQQQVAHLQKTNTLSRNEGLKLVRSLNNTQMSIFYQVRTWCLQKVSGQNPVPFHVFITGGAGTGKSHLIKALQYEATRLLSPLGRHPDELCVLLTAPTGIAAYNLNASTIHTTFSIATNVTLPYTPLGEEKINTLRAKYSNLQILVIDEISMVDHRLLAYVHGRLRQIKQSGNFSPFGNVCVIAVGDFFQLPPVKGKALYVDDLGNDLWSTNFKIIELTVIQRQKDTAFAELLNRLRKRSKSTPMLPSDTSLLRTRETGEESSSLHIFPTNAQVETHNVEQLLKTCEDHVKIDAQDYERNKKTGKLELKRGHHATVFNTTLAQQLVLGENARVMLTKNVDMMDGLVNGVCGTVTHIVNSTGNNFPKIVYVQFDDKEVGAQTRGNHACASSHLLTSTPILPQEDRVTNKGGLRRQFPLKLSWACTIHKVQGITVANAVVSLKKIFAAGQAYVALSRITTLSGLILQDFKEDAIYCNNNVQEALQCMQPFLCAYSTGHKSYTHNFRVLLMNVQGLPAHVKDLLLSTQHLQLNCIAVTETWLTETSLKESVNIIGYTFDSCPRSTSYNSRHPVLLDLQAQQHGGVAMYTEDSLSYNILQVPNVNIECLVFHCATYDMLLAVIYRPPSYAMSLFKEHLEKLLSWLEERSNTITVMGDFNDDIRKSSTICDFMTDNGYIQIVTQPTTEKGTLIDHVYVRTTQFEVEAEVVPMYFSDHEGVVCSFTTKTFHNVKA
ncbi:uncharacterized protein LOC119206796 [Pungitius pungitius]|uniref:uncharacterized protein LOC119206796 n=1 Tax=Pungitius pungitius TaxID=134920 RepID=UPI002E13BE32